MTSGSPTGTLWPGKGPVMVTDGVPAAGVADRPMQADDFESNVTISLGVATYHGDAPDTTILIRAADEALLQAKLEGRNRVCVTPRIVRADDARKAELPA